MIVELGHFALLLALCVAIVQSIVPMWGAHRNNGAWMAVAEPAALVQLGLVAISFAALTWAYVTSDFTVVNVVTNSHSLKPMLYKVSGVWGNHEGSMLLWVLILALFGALVALFGRNIPPGLRSRTLAVQAIVAVGFYLFIVLTSNPFERIWPAPADGQDLNPLLQDPGLAFHPPMLYVGYVGFSIVFSFAIAALIEGKVDAAWARWVRPWTLLAWAFLTGGIALGSWWAYYELGWGGWWFWDPVENASFMPWLAGTALLHSAIVVEKRDTLKTWTILLAIVTFSLSLLGTFLVRSGVLTSVHSFAVDPDRGLFILLLMLLATGGGLALYAWRAPLLKGGGIFAPVSREGAMILNNLFLVVACGAVLLGTLYPLLHEGVTGEKITVGAPYFNLVFVPLMTPILAATAIGPLLAWKRGDLAGALERLKFAGALAAVTLFVAGFWLIGPEIFGLVGAVFGVWLLVGTITVAAERVNLAKPGRWRRAKGLPTAFWGMIAAHAGLAIAVFGMVGIEHGETEHIGMMRAGDTATLSGYHLTFEGVAVVDGPNYQALRGRIVVREETSEGGPGELVTVLEPENRRFIVSGDTTTEAAIRSSFFGDIYGVIGTGDGQGAWTVRVWNKPLTPWLWTGCIMMVLGGLVSLTDRRLRIGVPASRRQKTPAGAASHGGRAAPDAGPAAGPRPAPAE